MALSISKQSTIAETVRTKKFLTSSLEVSVAVDATDLQTLDFFSRIVMQMPLKEKDVLGFSQIAHPLIHDCDVS